MIVKIFLENNRHYKIRKIGRFLSIPRVQRRERRGKTRITAKVGLKKIRALKNQARIAYCLQASVS